MIALFRPKLKKNKTFYNSTEIIELLVRYHTKKDQRIVGLKDKIRYFQAFANYHELIVVQKYDILSMDEASNSIHFKDSQDSEATVLVYVKYHYFSPSDIVVEYNPRVILYGAEIFRFGIERDRNKFFYFGYRNGAEVSNVGHGFNEQPKRRVDYDASLEYLVAPSIFSPNDVMTVPMVSKKTMLIRKYQSFDLSFFKSDLFTELKISEDYLEITHNQVKVSIVLDLDEKKVQKSINRAERVFKEESYNVWLEHEIKAIYELYEDWYIEGESPLPFIKDLEVYKAQYHLISLFVDIDGSIGSSFMDDSDSFAGHGTHIDIGPKGKIHRFSI